MIVNDPAASESGEARRWPLYLAGVVIGAGAAVAGVLIAATHPSPHAHHHGPLFVVVFGVVLGGAVAAGVVWSLRRQFNRPAMRRLRRFSFAQRRATARAVNRGQPLAGDQRAIAQAQLEQLGSSTLRARWVFPVAVVAFAVLAAANTGGMRWLWAAIAVLELVSGAGSVLLFRRQRNRLAAALARPGSGG